MNKRDRVALVNLIAALAAILGVLFVMSEWMSP